jgi:hypothetical protein
MKPILTIFILIAAAFAQGGAGAAPPPAPTTSEPASQKTPTLQAPPADAQRGTMTILISGMDVKGNPVAITKESLRVMDSGASAEVVDVKNANALPIKLGIILTARGSFDKQKAAAMELIQKVLRPGVDQAIVVTAGGQKLWSKPLAMESDPAVLAAAVKAMDRKEGLADLFNYSIDTGGGGTNTGLAIQSQVGGVAGQSVYETVWSLMASDPRPARRVLVLFRDPVSHSAGVGSQRFAEYNEYQHDKLIYTAQVLRAPIYVVGISDVSPMLNSTDIGATYNSTFAGDAAALRNRDEQANREKQAAMMGGRSNMERLGIETGGRAWYSSKKNYTDAVGYIVDALKNQYAVTFVPNDPPANTRPSLELIAGSAKLAAPKSYPMRRAQ